MTYTECHDLEPREPVGAVLRIGGGKSQFGKTSRRAFIFVLPHCDHTGDRPAHPDFHPYNKLPEGQRSVVRGNLVHHQMPEPLIQKHAARVLGPAWKAWPKSPPVGRWACEGDAIKATRIHGIGEDGKPDFREIDCPGRLCQFSQSPDGKAPPPCKVYSKLLFQPRWGQGFNCPAVLTRFESGSPNTGGNLKGFFAAIADHAAGWGLESYSLYGLPFVLQIVERTQPDKQRRFPVVTMAADGDLAAFFANQRRQLEEMGGKLPAMLTAPEEPEAEPDSARDLEGPLVVEVPGQGEMFE